MNSVKRRCRQRQQQQEERGQEQQVIWQEEVEMKVELTIEMDDVGELPLVAQPLPSLCEIMFCSFQQIPVVLLFNF